MKGLARIWRDLRGNGRATANGKLVLVVGPSGAGKDTLISHARNACRGDPAIVFPRRVVTRAASAYEDHDTLSGEDFIAALRAGRFALFWEAHGLRYGIPVAIEHDLHAGRAVVCNVSRTILAAARGKYPGTTVVLVTAPPDVLAARLAGRKRESEDGAAERLSRSVVFGAGVEPDVVIENVGAPEAGARQLLAAIRGRTGRDFPAEFLL